MPTDPVQVVGEARKAHWVDQWIPDQGPMCVCGAELSLDDRHEPVFTPHQNQAIAAALREAGLLAEGEVVGYAVVRRFVDESHWAVAFSYEMDLREASGVARRRSDETREFRVAALHLLPDTEEAGERGGG